jgi:hypothetical protein
MALPFITTSSKLRGSLLPLRGEPHGCGFPAGRTPDNNQAPCLEGLQTMPEVALVPWHGSHQLLMTAREHAAGALVVCRSPWEERFLPAGEARCCQRGPLCAGGKRATGGRHLEGGQLLVLDR